MTLVALDLPVPAPRKPLVSRKMLEAGRKAFMRHRKTLDDLRDFYPEDRDAFIAAIYRAMVRATRV